MREIGWTPLILPRAQEQNTEVNAVQSVNRLVLHNISSFFKIQTAQPLNPFKIELIIGTLSAKFQTKLKKNKKFSYLIVGDGNFYHENISQPD